MKSFTNFFRQYSRVLSQPPAKFIFAHHFHNSLEFVAVRFVNKCINSLMRELLDESRPHLYVFCVP